MEEVVKEVQRKARIRGADKGLVIEEAIRKYMKEVDHKKDCLGILDTYSGGKRVKIENTLAEMGRNRKTGR